jgi:hypothetical protein
LISGENSGGGDVDIVFISAAVPETSSFALLLASGLALVQWRRRSAGAGITDL